MPGSAWVELEIRDQDGQILDGASSLPASFAITGVLRRPDQTAGLVLLPPDSKSGWVFLPEGRTRRGVWWTWENGEPAAPLQGIPFDKPFIAQTQSFFRLLLSGWQGAIILFLSAWVINKILHKITTRNLSPGWYIPSWLIKSSIVYSILLPFAIALHVSVGVLERIPHVQDSVTYLFQAQTLARGALTAPAPPLAESGRTPHFDQEFLLVRDGRWFGKYPPGYPAVLSLGVRLGAHWLVNPLLAALTVALIYALARALYRNDRRRSPETRQRHHTSPLTAGDHPPVSISWPILLLTISPFFLIMSGSLMAHPAEMFWTALFMLAWARVVDSGRSRWAIVSGVGLGMLFLTRQFTALTVGVSFGIGWAALTGWRNRGIAGHLSAAWLRRLAISVLILLAVLAPFALVLPAYQAAVTGDPFADPRLLYWPYDRVGFGPGTGEAQNVFTFTLTSAGLAQQWSDDPYQPPRGNSPSLGLYNLGRNLDALENDLFAWSPLFTLSFIWLAFLLRRPAAADWGLFIVATAIAGEYIAYWAAGIAYGPRYFYAALPALVILSGRGIDALAAATGRRATAIILLALFAYGWVSLPGRIESYRGYNFVSREGRAAIKQVVDQPALVFVSVSEVDWWEYGSFFSGNTPWLDSDIIYARDLGAAENERLRAIFPDRHAYLWREQRITPFAP